MEQLRIKEYGEALALLDEIRQKVESGEIMSVLVLAEHVDGSLVGGSTATQNTFTVCGHMFSWALRRMGFMQEDDE